MAAADRKEISGNNHFLMRFIFRILAIFAFHRLFFIVFCELSCILAKFTEVVSQIGIHCFPSLILVTKECSRAYLTLLLIYRWWQKRRIYLFPKGESETIRKGNI